MFSLSLFFIVLRKLSARPKPQVSQEREGKNTIKTKSPATSSSSGRDAHCLHASFRRGAPPCPSGKSQSPGCSGVSAKPLSPPVTAVFVPPSALAPRHPFPFPFLWLHQGLQPMNQAHGPLSPSLKLPHSHLQVTARKFSREGPGVRRPWGQAALGSGGPGFKYQLSHPPAEQPHPDPRPQFLHL